MSQAFDKFVAANQLLLTKCSKETLALAWNAGVEAARLESMRISRNMSFPVEQRKGMAIAESSIENLKVNYGEVQKKACRD